MGLIDLFLFELDGVSFFDAGFFVDFKTDDDIFRDGVLFDLQGVFFPFFAKTFGAFALFLFVIVIVSGGLSLSHFCLTFDYPIALLLFIVSSLALFICVSFAPRF